MPACFLLQAGKYRICLFLLFYYLVKLQVGYHPVAVVLQLHYSVHHTTTNNKE
jgi:hypothetical protein